MVPWFLTTCSSEIVLRLGQIYRLRLQGGKISQVLKTGERDFLYRVHGGDIFVRNTELSPNYMALQARRLHSPLPCTLTVALPLCVS
jgi:hypothetical protein